MMNFDDIFEHDEATEKVLREYCRGIKGIVFDYGGTIDSGGEHWSEVIYRAWKKCGVDADKKIFREAYVHAERTLGKNHIVEATDDFLELLRKKMRIELEWLVENGHADLLGGREAEELADKIAEECDGNAREWVDYAKPLLRELDNAYPLVLVSNFYGNVNRVLESYGLAKYFKAVIESAVVGVRKPDPAIFILGVEALQEAEPDERIGAGEVLVVGDSFSKDIEPALKAGCRAVWLKGKQWSPEEEEREYPYTIKRLWQLREALCPVN